MARWIFSGKDLVNALKDLKDEKLMAEFKSANDRAIQELKDMSLSSKNKNFQSPRALRSWREKYVNLLALRRNDHVVARTIAGDRNARTASQAASLCRNRKDN